MRELKFEIIFKSPVVLQASSNTQGKVDMLDFIPGSAFLGMAASKYEKFDDPFKIFHSGAVKFCDASPVKNGKEFFKIPLSYFHEKLDDGKIYNHHLLDDSEFEKFTQLKQMRNGYMNDENERLDLDYEYSQKSAYDKDKRRSAQSQMYGYKALKAGSVWRFSVKFENSVSEDDIKLVKETLENSTRLGKSKSAEYGAVEIKFIGEDKGERAQIKAFTPPEKYTFVYAKSRLALIDENGNPSYDVKYILPNLDERKVDYDKTQIRISNFTPYNAARGTKDYERICINKGSVIALKELNEEQIAELKNGIGAYLSEGFGEVLINPYFLNGGGKKDEPIEFKEEAKAEPSTGDTLIKSDLAKFLKQKQDDKNRSLEIAQEVAEFIAENNGEFSKISNSQWGAIRAICKASDEGEIYNEIENFTTRGVSAEIWKKGSGAILLKAIKASDEPLKFALLLSMQMPKTKNGEN